MKLSHFVIIFLSILLIVITPKFLRSDILQKNAQNNNIYSSYLITATKSAIDVAQAESQNSSLVFQNASTRTKSVDAFYQTLIRCFDYEYSTYENLVYQWVPCVFLVDTNGFYVEHGEDYTDPNGIVVTEKVLSPIQKWSKSYSPGGSEMGYEYYVEFHLDDTINVIYTNYRLGDKQRNVINYSGYYEDVYHQILADADRDISSMRTLDSSLEANDLNTMLSSYQNFSAEKKYVIISTIQDQMEYYINSNYTTYNQNGKNQYQFSIPQVTGLDWARLVDAPTVLAFLQGKETEYNASLFNVYALAGSELEYDHKYYIVEVDGVKYYHTADCPHLNNDISESVYYSMERAAQMGAYPCPDCT